MILLDTNVLSELMRQLPEQKVLNWLDRQQELSVWICAITVAEIRLGIALLPQGNRKDFLADLAEAMFQEEFLTAVYHSVFQQRQNMPQLLQQEPIRAALLVLKMHR